MKKVLFIDRDGTLVIEPPIDYQLDAFEKLEFYPKVFRNLYFIRHKLDFEFVMVTNQDGLGTPSFPETDFWPVHNLIMKSLENEGITFDRVLIDRSFPEDNAPTRKPRTGMLTDYLNNPEYDLSASFVIGDRATDVELARNLGCKAILLQDNKDLLKERIWRMYACWPPATGTAWLNSSLPENGLRKNAGLPGKQTSISASIWTETEPATSIPDWDSSTTCSNRSANTEAWI